MDSLNESYIPDTLETMLPQSLYDGGDYKTARKEKKDRMEMPDVSPIAHLIDDKSF